MQRVDPKMMMVGGAPVILPAGRIRPNAWPELAFAVLLEPEPEEMAVWIERLEKSLGVTRRHRKAAAERAAAARESSEAKRRRILEQSQRAATLNGPLRDPSFVRAIDEKNLELAGLQAEAARLQGRTSKAAAQRLHVIAGKLAKLVREIDKLRADESTERSQYGAAADAIISARIRGEEVEAFVAEKRELARDEHGALTRQRRGTYKGHVTFASTRSLQARKLTGLEHAFANGYLEGRGCHPDRLLQIGEQYREAYEIAEGKRSAAGGEGGGGYGPKGPQVKAVEAGEMLTAMRAALTRREQRVLDLVCGEDLRVREAATIMKAGFPATVRALCGGLRAAGIAWRETLARRYETEEQTAAERVRGAHRIVGQIRL